jgi:TonB family protein
MKTNRLSPIAAAFALSSSLLLPSNAAARDWGYVGGWYVTSADKSCGMYAPQVRPQSAEVLILKRLDGAIYVQAKNAAWAIAPGSEELIQYQIDGRTYRGAQKTAAATGGGISGGTGKGLLAAFGGDFENELRGGSTLTILNNGRQVEQIPLTGTSAALATITSCLDDLRANGNTPAAGFASLAASSVSPKGDVSRWINIDDYPSGALREGREGTVGFRLSVGNDGRVFGCTITKSSGHADLDEATCNGVTKRARFDPAKDTSGARVAGSYQSRVSWKLPN